MPVVRKSMIVLANSMKRSERCIAGRELLLVNGQTVLSSWLRPVSNHGEGELTLLERVNVLSNLEIGVGDIVDVSLDSQQSDPSQPENWLLFQSPSWTNADPQFSAPALDQLEERPISLWAEPGTSTDRCRDGWLAKNPPTQSLYVVRAEQLVVRLSVDPSGKVTRRCLFEFGGAKYDLSLTDPEAFLRLGRHQPRPGTGVVDVPIGSVRICVSLARSFQGFHYKVVATILEGI